MGTRRPVVAAAAADDARPAVLFTNAVRSMVCGVWWVLPVRYVLGGADEEKVEDDAVEETCVDTIICLSRSLLRDKKGPDTAQRLSPFICSPPNASTGALR